MEKKEINYKKYVKEYLPFSIFVLVIILIRVFICTPINVNGSSMSNTLKDGDIMILNKIALRTEGIQRFDIVVIRTDSSFLMYTFFKQGLLQLLIIKMRNYILMERLLRINII